MCENLEEHAKRNNSKGLFQQVKQHKGVFKPRAGSIKSKVGTILTESKDIKQRWLEYTKSLRNR